MDDLFQTYGRLIASCADKLCRRFDCPQFKEDLISVGNITLLEKAQNYNPESEASMATYLYPHLLGDMRRELEKNLYPISLPKDQFKTNGHRWLMAFSSLDNPVQFEKLASAVSVEQQVLQDIYLDCLKVEFENLSFKERQILGGFFGVYGNHKQTAAEIAEEFQMKENALLKAKDRALQKLRCACENSEMGLWKGAAAVINDACRECGSESSYIPPQQVWYLEK